MRLAESSDFFREGSGFFSENHSFSVEHEEEGNLVGATAVSGTGFSRDALPGKSSLTEEPSASLAEKSSADTKARIEFHPLSSKRVVNRQRWLPRPPGHVRFCFPGISHPPEWSFCRRGREFYGEKDWDSFHGWKQDCC